MCARWPRRRCSCAKLMSMCIHWMSLRSADGGGANGLRCLDRFERVVTIASVSLNRHCRQARSHTGVNVGGVACVLSCATCVWAHLGVGRLDHLCEYERGATLAKIRHLMKFGRSMSCGIGTRVLLGLGTHPTRQRMQPTRNDKDTCGYRKGNR